MSITPVLVPPPAHSIDRNFGLDLARFMAIASVVAVHCFSVFLGMAHRPTPMAIVVGGMFGVELFFVLSGFLIGRLLFDIVDTDPTPRGWAIFMVRRWLRTLPLYFVWLVLVAVVLPGPTHLLRYMTLTQNLAWPMPADHWFNESWSLAIEEWFYILFSVALIGTAAATRGSKLVWPVILAFILIPPVLRLLGPAPGEADPDLFFNEHIYHVVLYRLDAIAYGVALARLYHGGSRLFAHPWWAGGAGLVLVGAFGLQNSYGVWLPVSRTAFRNLQLVGVGVGFCLLLIALLRMPALPGPLGWVVRTCARISYGMYLMNITIIFLVVWYAGGYGLRFDVSVCLALILLLPYLSQRFFEAPLMRLRPRQMRPPVLADVAYEGQRA
jgi:peptidoglycan/LPS O-acetylase OafA/YrhL